MKTVQLSFCSSCIHRENVRAQTTTNIINTNKCNDVNFCIHFVFQIEKANQNYVYKQKCLFYF